MILDFYPPPSNERTVLSENASEEDIASALLDYDWDDIAFLVLRVDDDNWFEVSGSLQPSDENSGSEPKKKNDGRPASHGDHYRGM